jgi:hypothetical protein
MKKNITISIDFELVERLIREDNYSALINRLINDHYAKEALNNKYMVMSVEELERLKELQNKKIQLVEEVKKIEDELIS